MSLKLNIFDVFLSENPKTVDQTEILVLDYAPTSQLFFFDVKMVATIFFSFIRYLRISVVQPNFW